MFILITSDVPGHLTANVTYSGQPYLAQVPVGFALSLSITCCTRLLLNIREAYYAHVEVDSDEVPIQLGSAQGTAVVFSRWLDDDPSARTRSIYAEHTSRDEWAFELREMKWSGK